MDGRIGSYCSRRDITEGSKYGSRENRKDSCGSRRDTPEGRKDGSREYMMDGYGSRKDPCKVGRMEAEKV